MACCIAYYFYIFYLFIHVQWPSKQGFGFPKASVATNFFGYSVITHWQLTKLLTGYKLSLCFWKRMPGQVYEGEKAISQRKPTRAQTTIQKTQRMT